MFDYAFGALLAAGLWVTCLLVLATLFRRVTGSGSRALATVLEGLAVSAQRNMPLPVAVRLLSDDSPRSLRRLLDTVAARLANGAALGQALRGMGRDIPEAYAAAIMASENHGGLADVLTDLAGDQEERLAARHKAFIACVYPLFAGTIFVVFVAYLTTMVIPRFALIYTEYGLGLPRVLAAMRALPQFCSDRPLLAALVPVASVGLLMGFYTTWVYRWPFAALARPADYVLLAVPGLRRFVLYSNLTHLARTIAIALRAGATVPDALSAGSDLDLASPLRKRFVRVLHRVQQGATLADACRDAGMFPKTFVWLVDMGERNGNLAEACDHVATIFRSRTDHMLRCATSLLMPLSILVIGVVEGFVVIGLYASLIGLVYVIP